ncbi:hypothetical protein HRbin36_02851 [bacterium HR36]|nr:hypothetical protein HRbin36_02851 [bacterium HR36]
MRPYHVGFLRALVLVAAAVDIAGALLRLANWCTLKWLGLLVLLAVYLAVLFAGTWLITAIVMYLAVTPPRHRFIYGMQVRYLFPCLLAGLWLPLSLAASTRAPDISRSIGNAGGAGSQASDEKEDVHEARSATMDNAAARAAPVWPRCRAWVERVVWAVWTAAFSVFTAGRLVGLVADLLARYW